jgi:hypothetical protein
MNPHFRVVFEAMPGTAPYARLKRLLKHAGRWYGMKVVSYEEIKHGDQGSK